MRVTVGIVIVIIGVCHIIMAGTMPLLGDDLVYSRFDVYYDGSILYYPRWVLRHWTYTNGRFPNLIAPIFLYFMPLWVLRVCTGVMVSLWLWLMLRVMGLQRSLLGSAIVLCIVVFGFTWWDSFTLFVVHMNYVWAIVMILWFMLLLQKPATCRLRYLNLLAVAVLAGMSHEAASLPLMCGLCVYLMLNGGIAHIDMRRRAALIVFMAGTCLTLFSPGIIRRFGAPRIADDTPWGLLIGSAPVALAALLLIIVCLWATRRKLREMMHAEWIVYAIAAIVSLGCMLMGGIVGRSGWFAQTYALIAFCMVWRHTVGPRVHLAGWLRRVAAYAVLVAIIVHYLMWTAYQLRLSDETQCVMAAYDLSSDGVVYADICRRDMQPPYLLMKAQGVPEYDDAYLLSTLWALRGDSTKVLTVIPTAMRSISPVADTADAGLESLTVGAPGSMSDTIAGCFGRRRMVIDDTPAIAVPIDRDSIYYITRIAYDPANPAASRH